MFLIPKTGVISNIKYFIIKQLKVYGCMKNVEYIITLIRESTRHFMCKIQNTAQ